MELAPLDGGQAATPEPDALRGSPADTLQNQLVAAGRGDESAFADLYESVAPRVYGLVVRILRDVHQSEEITQEVFLQLWATSNSFDPTRGSALSWIMTMTHRRAVDRVRSTESRRRRDVSDAERSRVAPFDETAEAAHASLEARRVRAALASLSRPQRQALELAYFAGLTHTEISRVLEIPLGTAKTRIRDGLIRLRDTIQPVPTGLS